MKVIKKILLGFCVVILLLVCFLVFFIGHGRYYQNRFDKTELKISQTKLEKIWGEPDRVLKYYDGRKTVFYYTLFDEFVFNINELEEVDFKYQDMKF